MSYSRAGLAALVVALAAGASLGQPTPAPSGYLGEERSPDTILVVPPAPKDGDPRDVADRAVFRQTRALENSPRWSLAVNDVEEAVPHMLTDFSCSVGARLDPADAPKLATLLLKIRADVARAVNKPKNLYRRHRPFMVDDGPTCVEKTAGLTASPDYPSGHTTWSWSVGLIIAELAPDRTGQVLNRARAFGESRIVCGVHNASAIEEGRTDASALVAALHGDAAFRADMDAARAEMATLRAKPPAPAHCEAEAEAMKTTPW